MDLSKYEELKVLSKRFYDFMLIDNLKAQDKKAKRIKNCASYLDFYADTTENYKKLAHGFFCHDRFCPVCSNLKMRRDSYELLTCINVLKKDFKFQFLMITLTVKNVSSDQLKDEIKKIKKSFKKFRELQAFKKISRGYVCKLEVTYNKDVDSYHPHLHLIVAVNSSYFTSRDYLSREKILTMWRNSYQDQSITQVDIRKINTATIKDILEITSYAAKNSDLFFSYDVFKTFYNSLRSVQILSFNGSFRDIRKKIRDKEIDLFNYFDQSDFVIATKLLMYNYTDQKYKLDHVIDLKKTSSYLKKSYHYILKTVTD